MGNRIITYGCGYKPCVWQSLSHTVDKNIVSFLIWRQNQDGDIFVGPDLSPTAPSTLYNTILCSSVTDLWSGLEAASRYVREKPTVEEYLTKVVYESFIFIPECRFTRYTDRMNFNWTEKLSKPRWHFIWILRVLHVLCYHRLRHFTTGNDDRGSVLRSSRSTQRRYFDIEYYAPFPVCPVPMLVYAYIYYINIL